jgi:hypothetical protein
LAALCAARRKAALTHATGRYHAFSNRGDEVKRPFLRPDLSTTWRRAQTRSMMAAGHRQRRREASLTAVSTVPILNEVEPVCCNRISARVVKSNPFIRRSLVCRDHGSLRGRCQIASSWVSGGSDAAM